MEEHWRKICRLVSRISSTGIVLTLRMVSAGRVSKDDIVGGDGGRVQDSEKPRTKKRFVGRAQLLNRIRPQRQ